MLGVGLGNLLKVAPARLGLGRAGIFYKIHSDPENPIYVGRLATHTSNSTWRDIKVYNDYAFIVSEASGHGMQVFDLTQLRTYSGSPITFSNSAHYNGFGNAHNIFTVFRFIVQGYFK